MQTLQGRINAAMTSGQLDLQTAALMQKVSNLSIILGTSVLEFLTKTTTPHICTL